MMRRHSNRVIERNRLEAVGQLYRDCDYLSLEHQQRIEELLTGEMEESPFDCNELERFKRRGIDEGIRMYREMSESE
jgi:hypothetical protein